MYFGNNLQYLRRLRLGFTQEALAEKLGVSRQTVSKWELGTALPEIDKAVELCGIFGCTMDDLFRSDLSACAEAFTDLRTETVPAFRYIRYTVISPYPEDDAIGHIRNFAQACGTKEPRIIGWDFPFVSPEQTNVYHLHGYTAAWILPEGLNPEGAEILSQPACRYTAIHIEKPFEAPFSVIPRAYRTLMDYMRLNGLEHRETDVIPCFETAGDTMDVYIACR